MTRALPLVLSVLLVLCAGCVGGLSASNRDGSRDRDGSTPFEPGPVVGGSNEDSPIGTNLSEVKDYTSEMPFVDLFKTSRTWIAGSGSDWEDGRSLDLDEDGWVRSLLPDQWARTLMLTGFEVYPEGRYIVLYDGDGTIQYNLAGADRHVQEDSTPGRDVLEIHPGAESNGIQLAISQTNPSNPIRHIRVLLPGGSCEADSSAWCDDANPCASGPCVPFEENYETQLFNPHFLAVNSRYAVIRFMNWMATNHSTVSRWDDRPKVSDARWTEKGVPLEIMVALAHRLGAEPWFTLPHLADDDYVTRFAEQTEQLLDPSLRAWVEFSNEVWNGIFTQHYDVAASCANGANQGAEWAAALVCYSERAVQVFRLWNQVYGGDTSRLVRVLAAQAGNGGTSDRIAAHQDAYLHADALAVAPYFGVIATTANEHTMQSMSVDALLQQTTNELLPESRRSVASDSDIAGRYGLKLVAYEGGQHFVGAFGAENNASINALYDAINRDPRMKDLYVNYLNNWREAGGEMFVHYKSCETFTKWGRFGTLEYQTQPRENAPKYDGVQTFIENNKRWW